MRARWDVEPERSRAREDISQDIFPTIWTAGSPPSNECALHLEREVPFTVGRPRRVRGRVEVFRLLAGVDEG